MGEARRLRGAARAAAAFIGFQSEAGQSPRNVAEPPTEPDWMVALDEHEEQEALEAVLHAPLEEMIQARFAGHPESHFEPCSVFRSRPMQRARGIQRMRETGDHDV